MARIIVAVLVLWLAACSQPPPQGMVGEVVKVRVFLLHGGIVSTDGVVTSIGMNTLADNLDAIPGVAVQRYLWANWTQAYRDVMGAQDDKVVVIGYSGGGMKATWLANGCVLSGRRIVYLEPPRIDLMILYDPSPDGSMQVIHNNVRRAINYHNNRPLMFGLGGGVLRGRNVETVEIAEQHLLVQSDASLHDRTIWHVRQLLD